MRVVALPTAYQAQALSSLTHHKLVARRTYDWAYLPLDLLPTLAIRALPPVHLPHLRLPSAALTD